MNPVKSIVLRASILLALVPLASCSAILDSMVDSAFDAAFDPDDDRPSSPRLITHGRARADVDHAENGSR